MPGRQDILERMCDRGVVAVVRARGSEQLLDVGKALLDGGVDCIEITMTTPNALEVIAACSKELPEALIGVGSVLDQPTAAAAIEAGARFVVSPVTRAEVIEEAHRADLPCVPGALTPTEILTASQLGADMVKVFPGSCFGPSYLKAVLAPMPHLKLTPTGGVDLRSAAAWIEAGAQTLGIGSSLVTKTALASGNLQEISDLARQYVAIVAEARAARKKG